MATVKQLQASDLYRCCDLGDLEFETTGDLEVLEGLQGQPRAVAAVEFGIGIDREGFNVFAFGAPGSGKHSAVEQFLKRKVGGLNPGDPPVVSANGLPDVCSVPRREGFPVLDVPSAQPRDNTSENPGPCPVGSTPV